jgi:hypothetical protein
MVHKSRLWYAARVSLFMLVALTTVSYLDIALRRSDTRIKRAAIIDPLYTSDPGYHDEMASLLEGRGYKVDSFKGEEVTVEWLRKMGSYRVVVLRVHSTCNDGMVWFFTGERYSLDKYVLEQLADEVHKAKPSLEAEYVFAVGSDFVRHFMNDRFSGALVVLMGCDGLTGTDLAEAFMEEGASAYVSWDGPVSLKHTDEAFLCLLEAMTVQRLTLGEAMGYTNDLVGADPDYNSTIAFYPAASAGIKIS